jgi:hypothetical protein
MPAKKKGLSSLDIFGLTSGIIGLVADVIGLSALFGLTQASINIPFSSWVTTLILTVYSSLVMGFYARRILCHINQKKAKRYATLSLYDYARIEHASTIMTCLIAATLCLLFLYNVMSNVNQYADRDYERKVKELGQRYEEIQGAAKPGEARQLEEAKVSQIDRLEEARSSNKFTAGFLILSFGFPVCVGLVAMINYFSKMIYKGCDSNYQVQ